MSVCCKCCVLSGRGLCDELITLPEESYRLCCVIVFDAETSWLRRPWPTGGSCGIKGRIYSILYTQGGPFILELLLNVSASLKNVIYYCYKSVNTNCTRKMEQLVSLRFVEASWNVMAHAQKPYFVFRQNGRVHLNQRGRQFSRLLAAEVCASAIVTLDTPCSEVVWRVLATHSIRQFPLHFACRASPCAITFQLESTSVTRNMMYSHVPFTALRLGLRRLGSLSWA